MQMDWKNNNTKTDNVLLYTDTKCVQQTKSVAYARKFVVNKFQKHMLAFKLKFCYETILHFISFNILNCLRSFICFGINSNIQDLITKHFMM